MTQNIAHEILMRLVAEVQSIERNYARGLMNYEKKVEWTAEEIRLAYDKLKILESIHVGVEEVL